MSDEDEEVADEARQIPAIAIEGVVEEKKAGEVKLPGEAGLDLGTDSTPLGQSFGGQSASGQSFVDGDKDEGPVEVGDAGACIEAVTRHQLCVDVLAGRVVYWDTAYLIRLREDWDAVETFHLKRLSELRELDVRLRDAMKEGTFQQLSLPGLPQKQGWFARRQSSDQNGGRFTDSQHEGTQRYLEQLLSQVHSIVADKNLQGFFSGHRSRQDETMLNEMLLERQRGVTFKTLHGQWMRKGVDCEWSIDLDGNVLAEGKERDVPFKMSVQGEGVLRRIMRPDGWRLDIEKSTKDQIFWRKEGEADLEWHRVQSRDRNISAENLMV